MMCGSIHSFLIRKGVEGQATSAHYFLVSRSGPACLLTDKGACETLITYYLMDDPPRPTRQQEATREKLGKH